MPNTMQPSDDVALIAALFFGMIEHSPEGQYFMLENHKHMIPVAQLFAAEEFTGWDPDTDVLKLALARLEKHYGIDHN